MPNSYVRKVAEETGKPVKEVEKVWSKAKNITTTTFKRRRWKVGTPKFYAYLVSVFKNIMGIEK